jgi:hypothetical protein
MATTFVFNEKITNRRIPDQVLLSALQRFAETFPRGHHRRQDFDTWSERPCNSVTVSTRFNGWRNALWQVGLTSARSGHYSPEDLIQILEEVWVKVGRAPGHGVLRKVGRISGQLYIRHWGSLENARSLFARYKRNEISRAELLAPVPSAPRPRRTIIRPTLRYLILQRDNHRCQLCGRSPSTDPDTILEIDHIHPVAKGGTDDPKNLRTLCRPCNRGKSATLELKAAA